MLPGSVTSISCAYACYLPASFGRPQPRPSLLSHRIRSNRLSNTVWSTDISAFANPNGFDTPQIYGRALNNPHSDLVMLSAHRGFPRAGGLEQAPGVRRTPCSRSDMPRNRDLR